MTAAEWVVPGLVIKLPMNHPLAILVATMFEENVYAQENIETDPVSFRGSA